MNNQNFSPETMAFLALWQQTQKLIFQVNKDLISIGQDHIAECVGRSLYDALDVLQEHLLDSLIPSAES